jgi:hypothetical protein
MDAESATEPGGPAGSGESPSDRPRSGGLRSGGLRSGGLSQAAAAEFDIAASIGGVRGVIESVVPYTVFSIVYAITKDLKPSIIAAAVPLVVLIIWRLIARETLSQALGGVFGIALGAWFAHKSGKASGFFLGSIFKNIGFTAAYVISIVVRWPLIGVILGPLLGEMFEWRQNRPRYVAYRWATWIWAGLFVVRLAVQVPLYLANNAVLLGLMNALVLGIPLFAITLWLTWLVLRTVPLAKPPPPTLP